MSPETFMHTGYTGTSLWIDPDHDLFVILLSNRNGPEPYETALQVGKLFLPPR